jgi:hypothetical protein
LRDEIYQKIQNEELGRLKEMLEDDKQFKAYKQDLSKMIYFFQEKQKKNDLELFTNLNFTHNFYFIEKNIRNQQRFIRVETTRSHQKALTEFDPSTLSTLNSGKTGADISSLLFLRVEFIELTKTDSAKSKKLEKSTYSNIPNEFNYHHLENRRDPLSSNKIERIENTKKRKLENYKIEDEFKQSDYFEKRQKSASHHSIGSRKELSLGLPSAFSQNKEVGRLSQSGVSRFTMSHKEDQLENLKRKKSTYFDGVNRFVNFNFF